MTKQETSALKIKQVIQTASDAVQTGEIGLVRSVSAGTAEINGLPNAEMNEVLIFKNGIRGMVQTLSEDSIGVVLLTTSDTLQPGDIAERSHTVLSVPVGESLLGRVITPLGTALDGKEDPSLSKTLPIERPAAPIMHRSPVNVPL